VEAEDRAITDMIKTEKPFLVIVNSRDPLGGAACAVQERIRTRYGLTAAAADCQALDLGGIGSLLESLLETFPLGALQVHLPRWMDALEWDHPIKAGLCAALLRQAEEIPCLSKAKAALQQLSELEEVQEVTVGPLDLASGTVSCTLRFPEALFYRVLSDKTGVTVENDGALMSLLTELSQIRQEYHRISDALSAVKATGYGIVMPDASQMTLQTPEVLKKNGAYGVKLKAGAPSIHMIRVDIDTEISPMVGDEQQSRALCDEDPEKLWQSNIFGKSVYELLQEGLNAKLLRTPEDVREKFRGTLTRIVNEGASGLICLIL